MPGLPSIAKSCLRRPADSTRNSLPTWRTWTFPGARAGLDGPPATFLKPASCTCIRPRGPRSHRSKCSTWGETRSGPSPKNHPGQALLIYGPLLAAYDLASLPITIARQRNFAALRGRVAGDAKHWPGAAAAKARDIQTPRCLEGHSPIYRWSVMAVGRLAPAAASARRPGCPGPIDAKRSLIDSTHRGVAQAGSAPDWGSGGRRFKSGPPRPASKSVTCWPHRTDPIKRHPKWSTSGPQRAAIGRGLRRVDPRLAPRCTDYTPARHLTVAEPPSRLGVITHQDLNGGSDG